MSLFIDQLLAELTLEEKIGMIHGDGLFQTKGVDRLGIPPFKMSDGPMGVRQEFENAHWIAKTDVDDQVTYLPSGSAIAASWNEEIAYAYGYTLGEEARGRGKDMILAPGINILRTPLCGRNYEYLSEDPFLTSKMAVPMVKGIQSRDVSSCVKHFAANNQETNRMFVDVKIDDKTLHEVYLKSFKACVKDGQAYAVMGAYNKLNGEHCSQSHTLLNRILRDQWDYKHIVVSDWFAVHDTRLAATSGIDIEMSVTNNFDEYFMAKPLLHLVKKGDINISFIDEKVRNILIVMSKLHMLNDCEKRNKGSYNTKKHQKVAYDIAKETIVLLKNENHDLPLSKDIRKLLIVGDNATRLHANKGGSSEIKALYEITPLEAIINKLPHCQVDFIQGYVADDEVDKQSIDWQASSLENKEIKNNSTERLLRKQKQLRDNVIDKASLYDHIIIFAGLNHSHDTETKDRLDITLPYAQNELIEAVLNVNAHTVVSLMSGSAVNMGEWHDKAKSICWSSYNGMHGGDALADVIFGDVNPSGKLTQTFANHLEDYAAHSIGEFPGSDTIHYKENRDIGYIHFQKANIKPLYPFGHGLSYTSFSYNAIDIEKQEDAFVVRINISNIGLCDGKEVVQLYAKDLNDKHSVYKLKGFKKVMIPKQSTQEVEIKILKNDFDVYDVDIQAFKIWHSKYKLGVGGSSDNLKLEVNVEV